MTIRYTLNGVDPTSTDTVIAAGGSLFLGNFTLRVFKSGCDPSGVQAATYVLSGPLTLAAVAAGNAHSLLLLSDGTLYSWGANASARPRPAWSRCRSVGSPAWSRSRPGYDDCSHESMDAFSAAQSSLVIWK